MSNIDVAPRMPYSHGMKTFFVLFRTALALLLSPAFLCAAPLPEVVSYSQWGPESPGHGTLYRHTDGNFYGMTLFGGTNQTGTIFRITPGNVVSLLHSFGAYGTGAGFHPQDGLVFDGGNHLWGTTMVGGTSDVGTVFKYNLTTQQVTTVVNFTTTGSAPGDAPYGALLLDGTNTLWGTTSDGGTYGHGTVFKINITTGALTTMVHFTGVAGSRKGGTPTCTLVADPYGYAWGITSTGGASGHGTLFKIRLSDGVFTSIVDFTGTFGFVRGRAGGRGLTRGKRQVALGHDQARRQQ